MREQIILSIITTGLGALIALGGVLAKTFIDSNFLKSPNLREKLIIKYITCDHEIGYTYQLDIRIYNNSKNDAYGFEIENLEVAKYFEKHDLPPTYPEKTDPVQQYITDKSPLQRKIILSSRETSEKPELLNEVNLFYEMDIIYYDQTNKERKMRLSGTMENDANKKLKFRN